MRMTIGATVSWIVVENGWVGKAGDTGTVIEAGPDLIRLKMDKHFDELSDWDNCAEYSSSGEFAEAQSELEWFCEPVEVV